MRDIIDGFLRFQRDIYPQRVELFKQLATSQNPKALFVTCSDSRVVPELLTQREPGELFVIRNAGNIVPSYGPEPGGVSATVEYAVAVLGVQDIVICGHSDCGAMGAISRCTCRFQKTAALNVRSRLHYSSGGVGSIRQRRAAAGHQRTQGGLSATGRSMRHRWPSRRGSESARIDLRCPTSH